jgi:hypothetical protein
MKRPCSARLFRGNCRRLFATFGVLASLQLVSFSAENAPEPDKERSIFEGNTKTGKDPFFPASTRREDRPVNGGPVVPKQVTVAVENLLLKGISGPPQHRLALINNQTFTAGETASVRTTNGPVLIRCLKILEKSVVITIDTNSEPKELRLREGI